MEQAGRKHSLGSPHIPQHQALLLQQQRWNEHFPSLWLTNSPPIPDCCEFEGEERRGAVKWIGHGGELTGTHSSSLLVRPPLAGTGTTTGDFQLHPRKGCTAIPFPSCSLEESDGGWQQSGLSTSHLSAASPRVKLLGVRHNQVMGYSNRPQNCQPRVRGTNSWDSSFGGGAQPKRQDSPWSRVETAHCTKLSW